jgi:ADP-heptose:LPS heptosyltransferase
MTFAPFPPRHLFLVRTHAIGDVLLTTPAIRALKRAWPGTGLTMLVGEKSLPVLEGNPHLDHLVGFPEAWWFSRRVDKILGLTRIIRRCPKDGVVLFHGSPALHVWGFLLKGPIRAGFDHRLSGVFLTHKASLIFGRQRYLGEICLDLVRALGLPAEDPEPELFLQEKEVRKVQRFIPRMGKGRWLIGVAPGGGQNPLEQITLKQWPWQNYAQLIIEMSRAYPATFLLLGDRHDRQVEKIYRQTSEVGVRAINLQGQTTLRELAALISRLDLLITNDSSPLHIGTALKTPLLALFGPTAAEALFLPGPNRLAIQSPAPCSPCYPFGRAPECRDPFCMGAILWESVLEATAALLERLGAPGRQGVFLSKAEPAKRG